MVIGLYNNELENQFQIFLPERTNFRQSLSYFPFNRVKPSAIPSPIELKIEHFAGKKRQTVYSIFISGMDGCIFES